MENKLYIDTLMVAVPGCIIHKNAVYALYTSKCNVKVILSFMLKHRDILEIFINIINILGKNNYEHIDSWIDTVNNYIEFLSVDVIKNRLDNMLESIEDQPKSIDKEVQLAKIVKLRVNDTFIKNGKPPYIKDKTYYVKAGTIGNFGLGLNIEDKACIYTSLIMIEHDKNVRIFNQCDDRLLRFNVKNFYDYDTGKLCLINKRGYEFISRLIYNEWRL